MPESVLQIHRLLARTARRGAALVLLRGMLLAAAALVLAMVFVTLAANAGWRNAALAVLVVGGGVAAAAAVWRWWGVRGLLSPKRQAAVIEALHPDLGGSLKTVVDRAARPQGSPGLFARLADEVGLGLAKLQPRQVWPFAPVWRDARWLVVSFGLLGAVALLRPLGPLDALQLLFGAPPAQAAAAPVAQSGPRAMLGDITLRYLYPTYTRLEPLEVPNTSGEVHAPLGTVVEIRARTAQPWATAVLEVSGDEPAPALLTEGRVVRGSFTLAREGVWRFNFGALSSPDYRIIPEPDLAPSVAVEGRARLRAKLDARVELSVSAKDDYGLARIVAEITVGGRSREIELRKPIDMPLMANELVRFSPLEWGLKPGDLARVRVGAWDNDEVSGSKPGWSVPFTIEVVGAGGTFREQQELREALKQALIPPLADFLVEVVPGEGSGTAVHRWADGADVRYERFDDVAVGVVGLDSRTFEARIVENVNGPRRDLFAFARGLGAGTLNERDAVMLSELHATNIRALEMAVWTLDRVQRKAAYQELQALVMELAKEARELRDELPNLGKPETLARLDQIVRLKAQVEAAAAKLDQGGIRQFLESRGAELDGAIAATRRAVAAGNRDAARADMQRVADLLDEMAGGVQEAEKRKGEADDKLGAAMKQLSEDLEDLAARQEALQSDVDSARSQHGKSLDEGMAAWKRVERATEDMNRELGGAALEAVRSTRIVQGGVDDARHDGQGLKDSVSARDATRAGQRVEDVRDSIARARARLEAARRARAVSAPEAAAAAAALDKADRAAGKAADALQELQQGQADASPELRDALRSLSTQQGEVAQRGREVAGQAQKLAREMPTDASAMEGAAAEGAEQSQRASESMQDGDALGASGAAGAATEAYRRAQEELEKAAQAMREMQQAGGGGGGGEPGEGEPQGGEGSDADNEGERQEVIIPAPEEFATPEEYRKALLEGMQGDVPEAYRAANRRYYEELVRQ